MDKAQANFYFLSILAGLMAAIGDSCLNQWAKHDSKGIWLFGGFVFWNVSLLLFLSMLKRGMLAQCVVLFIITNCILVLLISHFTFHAELSRQQWLGIFLAVLGVVVMELG